MTACRHHQIQNFSNFTFGEFIYTFLQHHFFLQPSNMNSSQSNCNCICNCGEVDGVEIIFPILHMHVYTYTHTQTIDFYVSVLMYTSSNIMCKLYGRYPIIVRLLWGVFLIAIPVDSRYLFQGRTFFMTFLLQGPCHQ